MGDTSALGTSLFFSFRSNIVKCQCEQECVAARCTSCSCRSAAGCVVLTMGFSEPRAGSAESCGGRPHGRHGCIQWLAFFGRGGGTWPLESYATNIEREVEVRQGLWCAHLTSPTFALSEALGRVEVWNDADAAASTAGGSMTRVSSLSLGLACGHCWKFLLFAVS